jgi:hypothetical protein
MIEKTYNVEVSVWLPNGVVYILDTANEKVNQETFDASVKQFRELLSDSKCISLATRGFFHLNNPKREFFNNEIVLWGETLKNSYIVVSKS